jgi:hypothetical protein
MQNRVSQAKLMARARGLELAGAIGGARALIRAVPSKRGPTKVVRFPLGLPPLLELARDAGWLALPVWKSFLDLPDDQQTDELLYEILAQVTWIVNALGMVVRSGDELLKAGRMSIRDWPQNLVREVAELVEAFEDLQETLALGLSAGFRRQLESARAQAQR